MKILFEHSGVLPVLKYGGTERIIFWLMKELVSLGHEVFLIGNPNSNVKNIGVKLIPHDEELKGDWRGLIPKDIDIIHVFYTPPFEFDIPVIVTIEGNGNPGETFLDNTVFVSNKHAEIHGAECFVYNGLDFDEYPFTRTPRKTWDNFLFLAKAKWKVKNLSDCVKACKKTYKGLEVCGGRGFSISRKIQYHGMVGQDQKIPIMEKVDALLWPVRWHEPFGIAIIEAFAQGLPVIGSTYGSLPELINPEVGIICNNYQEFEQAISLNENKFNALNIRNYVESKYSSKVMAGEYLKCYEKVLSGEKLNSITPKYQSDLGPEVLLSF